MKIDIKFHPQIESGKLTEFEKELATVIGFAISQSKTEPDTKMFDFVKCWSPRLLTLACKQIEAETKEPKPTEWSKEDEKMRELLIAIFEVNHPNDFFKANEINTIDMCGVHTEEIISWLKSLPLNLKKKNEDVAKIKKIEDEIETKVRDYYNISGKKKNTKEKTETVKE